mgnify:FL=1
MFVPLILDMESLLSMKIITHDGACKATTDQGSVDITPLSNTDGSPR